MKKIIHKIILLLAISVTSLFANAIENNTDRPGNDYRKLTTRSVAECAIACYTENKCKSWTFVKWSKCYLKDSTPEATYNSNCFSGLSTVNYNDVQQIVATYGQSIYFDNLNRAAHVSSLSRDKLKIIVASINQNAHSKLYISIKKNGAGLANKRVKNIKSDLASFGLSPSKYHVQKVTKKDKKKEWLSQNKHLWMRIVPIR